MWYRDLKIEIRICLWSDIFLGKSRTQRSPNINANNERSRVSARIEQIIHIRGIFVYHRNSEGLNAAKRLLGRKGGEIKAMLACTC